MSSKKALVLALVLPGLSFAGVAHAATDAATPPPVQEELLPARSTSISEGVKEDSAFVPAHTITKKDANGAQIVQPVAQSDAITPDRVTEGIARNADAANSQQNVHINSNTTTVKEHGSKLEGLATENKDQDVKIKANTDLNGLQTSAINKNGRQIDLNSAGVAQNAADIKANATQITELKKSLTDQIAKLNAEGTAASQREIASLKTKVERIEKGEVSFSLDGFSLSNSGYFVVGNQLLSLNGNSITIGNGALTTIKIKNGKDLTLRINGNLLTGSRSQIQKFLISNGYSDNDVEEIVFSTGGQKIVASYPSSSSKRIVTSSPSQASVAGDTASGSGSSLPSTATDNSNVMVVSAIMAALAAVGITVARKRRQSSDKA